MQLWTSSSTCTFRLAVWHHQCMTTRHPSQMVAPILGNWENRRHCFLREDAWEHIPAWSQRKMRSPLWFSRQRCRLLFSLKRPLTRHPRTTSCSVEFERSKWFVIADGWWVLPPSSSRILCLCITTPRLFLKAPPNNLSAHHHSQQAFYHSSDHVYTHAHMQRYKQGCCRPPISFVHHIILWLLRPPMPNSMWVSWWMVVYGEQSIY